MSKLLERIKNSVKNKHYYKVKEIYNNEEEKRQTCSACDNFLEEPDAMTTPKGERIHEACWEPGERDY